jgi:hypothetical protein
MKIRVMNRATHTLLVAWLCAYNSREYLYRYTNYYRGERCLTVNPISILDVKNA